MSEEEEEVRYASKDDIDNAIRARSTHERVLRRTDALEYRRELSRTFDLMRMAGNHDSELALELSMCNWREFDFGCVMVELMHYFHYCDCLDNIRRIRRAEPRDANDIFIHCALLNGQQAMILRRETDKVARGRISGCGGFHPNVVSRSIPVRMRIANEGWYSTSRVVMTRDCRTVYVIWEYKRW